MEGPARPPPKLISDLHMLRVSHDEPRGIRERLASSDEYELVSDRPFVKAYHGESDWQEDELRSSGRERRSRRRSRSRLGSNRYLNNGKSKAAPSTLILISAMGTHGLQTIPGLLILFQILEHRRHRRQTMESQTRNPSGFANKIRRKNFATRGSTMQSIVMAVQ